MLKELKSYKLLSLPSRPIKDAVIYTLDEQGRVVTYITDKDGVPKPLIDLQAEGFVQEVNSGDGSLTITGTEVVDIQISTSVLNVINSALQSGDNISELTNDAGYLTSYNEVNDLTSSVIWANVPDANITESSVTQHQLALNITESQILDLQDYLLDAPSDGSQYVRINSGWSVLSFKS